MGSGRAPCTRRKRRFYVTVSTHSHRTRRGARDELLYPFTFSEKRPTLGAARGSSRRIYPAKRSMQLFFRGCVLSARRNSQVTQAERRMKRQFLNGSVVSSSPRKSRRGIAFLDRRHDSFPSKPLADALRLRKEICRSPFHAALHLPFRQPFHKPPPHAPARTPFRVAF